VNWARLLMVAVILLACWVGWAWWQYRRIVRQFDAEREAAQWTEDRL
jgi:predicted negative regulator of RcsB-dependent stress response